MIGYRPYLLTLLALVLVAAVALDDIGSVVHPVVLAGAARAVNHGLGESVRAVGRLGLVDWILGAAAVMLVLWGWVRTTALARLGTIEIADLAADEKSLRPEAFKAALQQSLGNRGLLPASRVPGGSPTVASLAAAVADVPVPQVGWVAGLIALIPTPPAATSFRVTGALRSAVSTDGTFEHVLSYQVVCTGPRRQVTLGEARESSWTKLVDRASAELYCKITGQAPAIYPAWARWRSWKALVAYRAAILREPSFQSADQVGAVGSVAGCYESALEKYRDSIRLDPDNMLARLRAANCLERIAASRGPTEAAKQIDEQIKALEGYVSICLRQPTIFQAGYRASVLLGSLAQTVTGGCTYGQARKLGVVLRRLTDERSFEPEPGAQVRRMWGRLASLRRPVGPIGDGDPPDAGASLDESARALLGLDLAAAAARESRLARRRLRPLWTLAHERRLRHRFEPVGQERRQLRCALGVSRMCLRARARAAGAPGTMSNRRQYALRFLIHWRHLAGRSHLAGWQAHYNAACFYALLPQAEPAVARLRRLDRFAHRWVRRRSTRVRKLALRHLATAVGTADEHLSSVYARDDDPDLEVLRTYSSDHFELVLRRICPDEVVVHYEGPPRGGSPRPDRCGRRRRTGGAPGARRAAAPEQSDRIRRRLPDQDRRRQRGAHDHSAGRGRVGRAALGPDAGRAPHARLGRSTRRGDPLGSGRRVPAAG